jgi:hypothetical protein
MRLGRHSSQFGLNSRNRGTKALLEHDQRNECRRQQEGVASLRASVTILVSQLESRSRWRREVPFSSVRRNIVRLLAAPSVADDRIVFASVASPQNYLGTARGPIRFELVRRSGKWDKQNRSVSGLCPPALTRQDRSRKRSSFLLKQKSN